MKTHVSYLGCVTPTGEVHAGFGDHRTSIAVRPTEVEIGDLLPVVIRCGYGDQEATAAETPVWTEPDADGVMMEASRGTVRSYHRVGVCERYEAAAPEWAPAFILAVTIIREAAAQAESTQADVAAVCASYRRILDSIAREHAAHYARWDLDATRIARAFRRKSVQIGEQTVPGKVCVRSSRGNLLGYANCWDGRWLGSVERRTA